MPTWTQEEIDLYHRVWLERNTGNAKDVCNSYNCVALERGFPSRTIKACESMRASHRHLFDGVRAWSQGELEALAKVVTRKHQSRMPWEGITTLMQEEAKKHNWPERTAHAYRLKAAQVQDTRDRVLPKKRPPCYWTVDELETLEQLDKKRKVQTCSDKALHEKFLAAIRAKRADPTYSRSLESFRRRLQMGKFDAQARDKRRKPLLWGKDWQQNVEQILASCTGLSEALRAISKAYTISEMTTRRLVWQLQSVAMRQLIQDVPEKNLVCAFEDGDETHIQEPSSPMACIQPQEEVGGPKEKALESDEDLIRLHAIKETEEATLPSLVLEKDFVSALEDGDELHVQDPLSPTASIQPQEEEEGPPDWMPSLTVTDASELAIDETDEAMSPLLDNGDESDNGDEADEDDGADDDFEQWRNEMDDEDMDDAKVPVHKISLKQARSILFALTCLDVHDRHLFVQHLLIDRIYGDCPTAARCYKAGDANSTECRHAVYVAHGEVYMSGFRSYGDYLTANQLVNHLEVSCSCRDFFKNRYDARRDNVLQVYDRGLLNYFFEKWGNCPPSLIKVLNEYPVFAVQNQHLQMDKMMYMIGAVSANKKNGQRSSWYRAVLHYLDGWKLFIRADVGILEEWDTQLEWVPGDSAVQDVRRFQAVEKLSQIHPLVDDLLHRRADAKTKLTISHEMNEALAAARAELDQGQYEAAKTVLTSTGIVLVRGPYGCGKSHTISWMVKLLRECRPSEKVLLTAETNVAIDQVLRRLDEMKMPENQIVRLGACPESPVLKKYTLSERIKQEKEGHRGHEEHHQELSTNQALKAVINSARIVVATLSATGGSDGQHFNWSIVINDEGAQTSEQSLLMAIRKATNTLVLFGDPMQLPPFSRLQGHEKLRFGWEKPLHFITDSAMVAFSRDKEFPGVTLNVQYRCHAQISALVDGFYTEYKVVTAPNVSSVPYLENMYLSQSVRIGSQRVVMIDCCENLALRRGQRDYENNIERWILLEILVKISRHLDHTHGGMKEVAILSPYRAQCSKLERMVEHYGHLWRSNLKVGVHTIDSVQGDQAHIVLVSMCRNNWEGKVGFMDERPSRLIVQMSRAKDYLFIAINQSTYSRSRFWPSIMDAARHANVPPIEIDDSLQTTHAEANFRQGSQYFLNSHVQ
jgi:hypothetical protein